jgi:Flp pilus assembly pilin Flp
MRMQHAVKIGHGGAASGQALPISGWRRESARVLHDTRGAVFVEYIVLVTLVAFVMTLMLVGLGPSVVREYSARRATLYDHSP